MKLLIGLTGFARFAVCYHCFVIWQLRAVAVIAVLFAGCARYVFTNNSQDSRAKGSDQSLSDVLAPMDSSLPRDFALPEGLPPGEDVGDTMFDATDTLATDVEQPTGVSLVNAGVDPLNTTASGSLTWSSCSSSFSGEARLKDLMPGELYQLKLELDWKTDDQAGKNMSALGRTWDATIWRSGDLDNLLPAPYTGTGPGNEPAANIGDYLSPTEQEVLHNAGHELQSYVMFAFLTVTDAGNGQLTEDDTNPSTAITAKADGFHVPFFADFSWNTSTAALKGFITFPAGQYTGRFVLTRECAEWPNPLVGDGVTFTVGTCP